MMFEGRVEVIAGGSRGSGEFSLEVIERECEEQAVVEAAGGVAGALIATGGDEAAEGGFRESVLLFLEKGPGLIRQVEFVGLDKLGGFRGAASFEERGQAILFLSSCQVCAGHALGFGKAMVLPGETALYCPV
jgi:hypothetical protein